MYSNSELEAMGDDLARLTAELDQVQQEIENGRLIYGSDPIVSAQLDSRQAWLDDLRGEIQIAKRCIKELSS
jgi:hypothetical protein